MLRASVPPRPPVRYAPIADYGAVGDGRSVALVSREGSIDWWSPGRFDAPSLFASILDSSQGGHWSLGPVGTARSKHRYLEGTNVLETEHLTEQGVVKVRDLLVFPQDAGTSDPLLVRRVTGCEGAVEMQTTFAPRFLYGRVFPRFSRAPDGLLASGAGEIVLLQAPVSWLRSHRGVRHSRFLVAQGEEVLFVLRHAPFASPVPFSEPLAAPIHELERRTMARWESWSARTRFEGPDAPLVRRSALALKLLQFEKNGAFVAAATTSLPEAIGGVRNWDYRFTWLRDGAITARALHDVGHEEERERFTTWLLATLGERAEELRIMYTLSGSTELPERELVQFEGYRGSSPVRIGNGAVHQRQLDVYGEVVEYLHATTPDVRAWPIVRSIADWVVQHWREPDQGIWEMRCEPRHFVLSKAMAWVALDRAAHFADAVGERASDVWKTEAEAIRADVLARGVDARGAFMQAYGVDRSDASNLLLSSIGFVEANDPRMVATVDRVIEELTVDGLVYRYLGDDGLPGGEATFAYCTFWLVEALAREGRVKGSRAIFERVAERATSLGLYAEEIDPATGNHLGNFPQAFPHAGLIQAARALQQAEAASRG